MSLEARKVKCDEGKPHCNRCINTGRTCNGYTSKLAPRLLWHRPRQLFQSIDSAGEGRALQFFCEVAGPFLSGATDPYFWTHLVMQFSNFEPAVRHSVVAISSLYEQLQAETEAHAGVQLKDNSLALQHYNAAIRELKTTQNQPLVLLVCILFICIEFLQSNKEAAIKHCKYGIALLENVNYSWAREHLVPVFRRLSLFPFFFGRGRLDFPDLVAQDDPVPASFKSPADAQSAMDIIMSRALRIIRLGDMYRFSSSRHQKVPSELLMEQEEIACLLSRWKVSFDNLDTDPILPDTAASKDPNPDGGPTQIMALSILSIRYEVCIIWLNIAFDPDERGFDGHLDGFRRIVEMCSAMDSAIPEESRKTNRNPKFIFETGLVPILHFVATKCRDLDIRLEALRLIKILGVPRENLWEVDQMYALGRRVIEIEHDVLLDNIGRPSTPVPCPGLPPDERRIRFTCTEPKASVHVDQNGRKVQGWTAGFIMRSLEDVVFVHSEFIGSEGTGIAVYPISPSLTI
ncbi:hypothetical protein AAE478_002224 [Parahypoxylon ruwenzoriense]